MRWPVIAIAVWMWNSVPHFAAAGPAAQILHPAAEATASGEEDEYQGLPPGAGRDETLGICGACHSMKLVTQQGLSRSTWIEVFEYMVDEHEMPELEPEDHTLILNYLSKFYGPDRRAPQLAK
ncbi:MAG: hypothetical protein O3B08_19890 [Proteobacteria bacterium]|nr:hypothetical protein [Pseudomonadota bacterium]